LRWAFIDELAAPGAGALPFVEVSPENYMTRGGAVAHAFETVASSIPLLTHGLMLNVGGSDPLDRRYLDELRAFLRRVGARYHSDHLCWTGTGGRVLHDLLPLPRDTKVVRHVADRIRRVQDHIGVPFAVENISYYLTPTSGMDETEFLCAVLDAADCGLMLDVNNAWVNATNHGFDVTAHLDGLPLERVVQLHVAGGERLERFDGLVIDTHGAGVGAEVQALMARVVARVGPVPVVYERDHQIPALPDLYGEVAALQQAYDGAVAQWAAARAAAGGARGAEDGTGRPSLVASLPAVAAGHDLRSLEGVQAALQSFIAGEETSPLAEADADARASYFVQAGADPADAEALASHRPQRLAVYRQLVHNGVRGAVRGFLPRTRARRGAAAFEGDLSRWFARSGPRAQVLRHVPSEFVEWAAPQWAAASDVPPWLADLARHELLEADVEATLGGPAGPVVSPEPAVDRPLVFDRSACLARYEYAIHELPESVVGEVAPRAAATVLLAYRDAQHDARYLALALFAAAWVGRALAGAALGEAVVAGAADVGLAVDDDTLVRVGTLLADLAARGVVHGSGAAAAPR
jgi:uncharacterized protein (UPF0276 family)